MKNFIFNRLFACLLFCFFTSYANFSIGQTYKLTSAEKNMENWNHHIIYDGKGTILDVNNNDKKREYTATTWTADLNNMKSKEISFLDNKAYQFSHFTESKLYIFASDKDNALVAYQLDPKSFSLIGSPKTLFSIDDFSVEYRMAYSPDSSYFSILSRHHGKKESDDHFSGITYDAAFSEIGKYEFSPQVPVDEMIDIDLILSNQRTTAIICQGRKWQRKKDNEMYYSITTVTDKGQPQTKVATGMPAGEIHKLYWYFDKDNIAFIGLAGKTWKEFTSVACGTYNIASGKAENLKVSEFSGVDNKSLVGLASVKEIVENGIPSNGFLKDALRLPDNSLLLMYEQREITYPKRDATQPTKYVPSYPIFHSNEIYVIRLNADHQVEWFHTIQKKRAEAMQQIYNGFNYIVDPNGVIYILFHDHKDNSEVFTTKKPRNTNSVNIKKNSLACVSITPAGQANKTFAWDNDDRDCYMMPDHSIVNQPNEVIFLAAKKSKDGYFTLAKIDVVN